MHIKRPDLARDHANPMLPLTIDDVVMAAAFVCVVVSLFIGTAS